MSNFLQIRDFGQIKSSCSDELDNAAGGQFLSTKSMLKLESDYAISCTFF
jgi:hypothetical protein